MTANRKLIGLAALALALILFVAVNIIASATVGKARIDLTEDRLYTLSRGTGTVLADLQEPLLIRYFFSDRLAADFPTLRIYGNRVRDMLEEFAARSNGRITLRIIDPPPFSDAEDEAVAFGVQGVPINTAGDKLYFGLAATNSTDDREVIPFFQQEREPFLEYDLTRLVYNLANPKKPVVGVMTDLPLLGGVGDLTAGPSAIRHQWMVMDHVSQFFDIERLQTTASVIPDHVDVLLVVHPKDLAEETLYAIDQFVLGGGRAMIFVDPHSEVSAATPDPENPLATHGSNMPQLFEAWGFELEPGMIAGDLVTARKVAGGSAQRPQAIDYVVWLSLGVENINPNDIVTGELGVVNVATAGILRPLEEATTEFSPLLFTSPQSQAIERFIVQFQRDPRPLLDEFEPSGEPLTLAARITGTVATAFPDGPPSGGDADGHLAEAVEPINVIVAADTDMLDDKFWVQVQDFFGQRLAIPAADNAAFLGNALDHLSGSGELISLRSRGISQRPFRVVEDLRRAAEASYRAKEQELQQSLQVAERRVAELQGEETGDGMLILTDEQRAAIAQFRDQMVEIRRQLRDVQGELRKDIDRLGQTLKVVNIALMPLLVGMAAIGVSLVRRRQRRRGLRIG